MKKRKQRQTKTFKRNNQLNLKKLYLIEIYNQLNLRKLNLIQMKIYQKLKKKLKNQFRAV